MFERGEPCKLKFDKNDPKSASKTHQSFAKDADINNIMGKYAKTGILVDPLNVDLGRTARFGDFSDLNDFGHLVNRIKQAQEDFLTLPAVVRHKFNNDVENALAFIADPNNLVECCDLGLLPESMRPKPVLKEPEPAKPATPA